MAPCKVILLACGSFNPPTNMHLRMFEIARDHLSRLGNYLVVGGVISPVHDSYVKKDLESSTHRLEMLKLALSSSDWIRLSDWEANQETWSHTWSVLQHHQNSLNALLSDNNNKRRDENDMNLGWVSGKVRSSDSPVTVKLLCGADLLESFSVPGLWKESDIENIVGQQGLVVVTREGTNPLKFIYDSDQLTRLMRNIVIVPEWMGNAVSSTKVRRALRRQESVKYVIPDLTLDYIMAHELFGYQKERLKSDWVCIVSRCLGNSKYNEKDFLNIPLNMLTPSPSDVNMISPGQEITLNLHQIDEPDAPPLTNDMKRNNFFKSETQAVYYPGHAVQVQSVEEATPKHKKVGFADDPQRVVTAIKQAPEVQKILLEKCVSNEEKKVKVKKPPRLSDPTRSRNVFKRSNSDVPTSLSASCLDATSVKIEFTTEGVKVISDKESIV